MGPPITPSPRNAIFAMGPAHTACSPAAPDGLGGRAMATQSVPANAALPVTIDDVRAARARIGNAVVRTPTLISRTLSELTGATVYLKFENLQFTAAYKERGALNTLLQLDA